MFEELAWAATAQGELSLRRRRDPASGQVVHEVKLGEDYLMSSQFVAGEVALASLALAEFDADGLEVVVGGLGLGYTAAAVLDDPRVADLVVVEAADAVIDWHRRRLVPNGERLTSDPRSRLVCEDFFVALGQDRLDPAAPGRRFDAVLVDIDHSPTHLLAPAHAALYTAAGLRNLAGALRPGGVFALWSNDAVDADFLDRLRAVFAAVSAEAVAFDNHLRSGTVSNTIYLARTDPGGLRP